MNYIIISLLLIRPFICEQANASLAIIFDIFFLTAFLLHIIFTRRFKVKKPIFFLSLMFPLFVAISNLFSINLFNSDLELLRIFVLVLMFNFVYFLPDKQRRILIAGMLSVSVIVCLRAIYQYFSGIDFIKNAHTFAQLTENGFYAWELLLQKRAVSWFSSPNILGGYLIVFCPLAFAYLFKSIREKNKRNIIVFTFLGFLLFLSVLITKAVAVFLSFILSMIFLVSILSKADKPIIVSRYFKIILLGFFICLLGLFFNRSESFINFENPQNSMLQRTYYWQSSLKIIKENPLTGVGAGNFKIIYPQFKNISANETIYAHNYYLQVWAESGFAAITFFCLFAFIIFSRALKKPLKPVAAGIVSGCFAVLVLSFFDYSLLITQSAHVWWILLAFVLSASEDDQEVVEVSVQRMIALKFCYLILVLFLMFNAFLFYKNEVNIKKSVLFFKNKEFDKSIVSAKKALHYKPDNDLAYYILARNFRSIEKNKLSENALNYYKKAIALNKNYAFYYWELAVYLFGHKKIDESQRFLGLARKFYPRNSKFQALNSCISKAKSN